MASSLNQTLYIADLETWMGESYFFNECFPEFKNEILKVTLMEHDGGYRYGFIKFSSHKVAKLVLETYRNKKKFVLNWSKEKSLFTGASEENFILEVVGALPKDVTKEELHQQFKAYYPSVKGAELHFSESLGRYGIVKFGNEHERDLATIQTHMQSFRKREHGKSKHFFYKDTATGYQRAAYPSSHQEDADSVQSTIYIQNLKKDVCERVLRNMFSDYGQITKVTLKACAIVQFAYGLSADLAVGCTKECVSAPIISDVEDFESMAKGSSNQTLCITSVRNWMDEAYFRNKCFPKEFQKNIVRVNIFKEGDLKNGIIEFTSHEIAEKVLEIYNIEREEEDARQKVCLSWNKQKWPLQRKNVSEGGHPDDYNLVVSGEILKDVAVEQFQRKLKICYPSVKDIELRVSKSQGVDTIIKFSEEHERDLATVEMHMQYFRGEEDLKSEHICYKDAASECETAAYPSTHREDAEDANSVRSTFYIQNLEKDVSEVQLRDMFSQFGPITKVTLQQCALIQFNNRLSANEAERDLKAGLVLPVSKEQADEDSPKDLKDLLHEDGESVSAYSNRLSVHEAELDLKAGLVLPVNKEQADEDSPKDHKDLPNEDGGSGSAYNTCGEEFSDEGSQSEYYDCYKEFHYITRKKNMKIKQRKRKRERDKAS